VDDLIATLKQQHVLVLELVAKIEAALTQRDGVAIQTHLDQLRTGLLAHLALEDSKLYPALVQQAESAGEAQRALVAKTFATNMQQISEALVRFLGRYATVSTPAVLETFSREWRGVVNTLRQRIDSEEKTLYPLYTRGTQGPTKTDPSLRTAAKG
jgi:hemerythrin-like domain-containing protein